MSWKKCVSSVRTQITVEHDLLQYGRRLPLIIGAVWQSGWLFVFAAAGTVKDPKTDANIGKREYLPWQPVGVEDGSSRLGSFPSDDHQCLLIHLWIRTCLVTVSNVPTHHHASTSTDMSTAALGFLLVRLFR